jgi:aminoglycoside phosphotransferase (APT) family kinase protein
MNKKTQFDKAHLFKIAGHFQLDGNIKEIRPYGSGHIHDTYRVDCISGSDNENFRNLNRTYILQQLNQYVYHDPPGVMDNIARVTEHIRHKLEKKDFPHNEISRRVLTVIKSRENENFFKDDGGFYWRMYHFIAGAESHDVLHTDNQLYQVARTFGTFLDDLSDLPGPPLRETIPDFHNAPKRYRDFERALAADCCNRALSAKTEIEFLQRYAGAFDVFPPLVTDGKIKLRVTHNDTKINNVMLDTDTDEGLCVIDLDTVMPGLAHFDFGDLGRTTLSPMAEDSQELSKVEVEIPRFEAILKGFMEGVGQNLNRTERDLLIFSMQFMTQLIGMRFLTDYLEGDPYFKVHRDAHNLHRCRRQFKLVQSILHKEDQLAAIAQKYIQ